MNYGFELTEMEFRLLRDLIHERSGLLFPEEKRSFFQLKLYARVEGLGLTSFTEYYNFLKYGREPERELARVFALLTNNETYFFRELPQLSAFRDQILPELKERRTGRDDNELKIVSAGCSTGEEVYTLAMLAYETGSFFWDLKFRVLGLDLNETAVETARRGVYYCRSFRMTEDKYVKKFFSANSGDWLVREALKRFTDFAVANIVDPATWTVHNNLDVLWCRNVLIYFSEAKIKATVELFHQALKPGGFLLLGHSESLTGISDHFALRRFPNTIAYQKPMD